MAAAVWQSSLPLTWAEQDAPARTLVLRRGVNEASPLQTFRRGTWLTGLACEVRALPSWAPGVGLGGPPLVPKFFRSSPSCAFPMAEGFLVALRFALGECMSPRRAGCRPRRERAHGCSESLSHSLGLGLDSP